MLQNITFTLFNPSFVEWHVLSIAVLLHDPVCFFFFLQAHPDILEFCSINQMNPPPQGPADKAYKPWLEQYSAFQMGWDSDAGMLSFYFFKCSAYDLHQTVPVSFL